MRAIGVGRCQDDLAVARQLDLVRLLAVVGERHAAHFGGVLRNHGDLGAGLDVAVGALQRDPIESRGWRDSSRAGAAIGWCAADQTRPLVEVRR